MPEEERNAAAQPTPTDRATERPAPPAPPTVSVHEPDPPPVAPEIEPAPEVAPPVATVADQSRPADRYAARERMEDDPDKPYFVTDWKGLRNYHCRACAEAGKHFASTRLERTMEHFSERHLPQTVDLGLVTPSGRPLRIRR